MCRGIVALSLVDCQARALPQNDVLIFLGFIKVILSKYRSQTYNKIIHTFQKLYITLHPQRSLSCNVFLKELLINLFYLP
jgi:hypothetical protein